MDRLEGFALVGVRPADAATGEARDDPGSSQSGKSAKSGGRAGRTAWWTTPRAMDGSSSRLDRTALVSAGA
jgi:hypothetical protein